MQEYTPTELAREIVGILRGRAARYDVTQSELAAATGVSQSQLSKMLRGKRPMDIDVMDALAVALGTTVSEIVIEAEAAVEDDLMTSARFIYVMENRRVEEAFDNNVTPFRPRVEAEPDWDEIDKGRKVAKKKSSQEELDPDQD
ncbi:helix-turn-helix transcriptional regulator [Pseudoclavibacter sp. AY1H1]|uniref:helix-turn-helix domain-containing protein n=1 Tax=Pseudoclavibacter sp. AY1H1 TaxID=2080584 RepID=UPI000CE7F36E|nr:helix-turn-helix transcriptional regulator [Pseudoclavibacter sp. AY1H1]PPF39937.1 hypothetical protein C5E05_01625 [Pseudoclavibacter sp. AY1H1]